MKGSFDGFSVNLYQDEDGDWLAHLVEMPGISAFADTPGRALAKLVEAWEETKESYRAHNEPIPEAPARKEIQKKRVNRTPEKEEPSWNKPSSQQTRT